MFRIRSILLTVALCGRSDVGVYAAGCHPAYDGSADYAAGDVVSATTTESKTVTESCSSPGEGDCAANGFKVTTTETTETHNYECVSGDASAFCSQDGFAPGGLQSSTVWIKEAAACSGTAAPPTPATAPIPEEWSRGGCPEAFEANKDYSASDLVSVVESTHTAVYQCKPSPSDQFCGIPGFEPGESLYWDQAWDSLGSCSGTIAPTPTTVITPEEWSRGGCPKAFEAGTDYSAADVVSVVGPIFTAVYQCKPSPMNQFCGIPGFEPGDSLYWEQAWDSLGSCSGTIAPTGSPSFVTLTNVGGCPSAFTDGEAYEEGDRVSIDGLVYECKSFPSSLYCSQVGYVPGTAIDSGATLVEYWKEAWSVVGFCSGTIVPTASPNFVTLADVGSCPDEWTSQTYEEGDKVSSGSLVFVCKEWPFSGHCGQAGYEPNIDPATPGAWRDAWTVAGHCSGSGGPTSSPTFNAAESIGACPDEWVAGSNLAYEEGDKVSVTVSQTPLRKIAYTCKPWPFSGFCGQFSPTQFGGDQGWTLAGSCDGLAPPTSSPSFDSLMETGNGCPREWSVSETDYEAGDLVSFVLSDEPVRKIVYECRQWPNTGYCNQGAGFAPGSLYGDMAWTLKGYCDGIMAPTAAPATYAGDCTYTKCTTNWVEQDCSPGETGCSCAAGQPASSACKKTTDVTTCTTPDVNAWSNGVDYAVGDVVRVGTERFKCREWPNFLWCSVEAFRPSLEDSRIWSQAWSEDGTCPLAR